MSELGDTPEQPAWGQPSLREDELEMKATFAGGLLAGLITLISNERKQ